MCGISILVNRKNKAVLDSDIQAMNNSILHRGPDDEGYYHGHNFAIGHRRLSIIDLSKAGHQPMCYNGRWITYNGEIYNYLELKQELTHFGYRFETATDTEVLLAAYDKWGVESFDKLNGMWAFAIYDANVGEIIFCRDHFGIKPLYYTQQGEYFSAGSEIKQLTRVEGFEPRINTRIVANFIHSGLLNYSDNTFFEDVFELPAGCYLRYDLSAHTYEKVKWYEIDKRVKLISDNFSTAVRTIANLFEESVRIRMRSDVPVGGCLSGGLDSSAIATTIHNLNPKIKGSFTTITAKYDDPQYDESEYSNCVVEAFGFTGINVSPQICDFWDNDAVSKLVCSFDQPFSGASNYNQFKVFEAAKKNELTVMMDGQGADEYFCGYGEFLNIRRQELKNRKKYFRYALHTLSNKRALTGFKFLLSELFSRPGKSSLG